MQKKNYSTGRLTTIVILVMVALFLLQYGIYSRGTHTQQKKNAIGQLSYLHDYVGNDILYSYTLSGSDSSVFIETPPIINLPIAGYVLLDRSEIVLAAASPFLSNFPLAPQLEEYTFSAEYSANAFLAAIHSGAPALTRFYCTPLGGELYAYSDVIDGTDISLIIFHYANILDSQISGITDLSNTFIVSTIVIVVVLCVWLYFARSYDRMILKRNHQILNTARRRYKTALASNRNYIWEYSCADDRMIWDETNAVPEILLDLSSAKRKEVLANNVVHPDDLPDFINFCHSIISPEPTFYQELRIRTPDSDEYEWYRINGTKILDKEGFPVSAIGQMTNINDKKLEFLALIEQAEQDQLTKLLHYAAFSKKAEKRITHMEEPVILALLLLDIDSFDELNSTYGVAFADTILIDLAVRMKKLCPENTLIGRYAADEFIILLDNIPSVDYVADMAQQIMNLFTGIIADTKITNTLSGCIGISLYPVDANSYDSLFEKAEIALYSAKQFGSGCYRIYEEALPSLPDSERSMKSLKRSQPGFSVFDSHTLGDPTLIANAIDILFDSIDIHSSINLILSVVGATYGLDRIFLRRHSDDGETSVITHEWNADHRQSYAIRGLLHPYQQAILFRGYEQTVPEAYHCDNLSESSDYVRILNDVCLADVKALVQCGIRSQNSYIGCVNFCITEKAHAWTPSELYTLSLLSKLISSYLLHLRSKRQIDYLSEIDSLTNVYNFNAFLNRVDEILAAGTQRKYAVIYSDISQFKLLNENYGYYAGDRVLISLASILQEAGGKDSVVARISGDKFVALYPYEDIASLTELVKSIVFQSKRIEYKTDDYFKLILMVGIYPIQETDSAVIAVDRANIARKNVDDYHLCNYKYYDESMHHTLIAQNQIASSMEDALKNHEFSVYYQPKFDLQTQEVIGAEALVRWSRQASMIPPISFIPLFEKNGFIVPLDYYVLESVCAFLRSRMEEGKKTLPVSVNFSRVHLANNVLPSVIRSMLKQYDIPPQMIQIEITESALSSIEERQIAILHELRSLGCMLSMDDFGSGMSSLNALRNLPFDEIKIDRDFLYSNSSSERERIVLSNVVRMAFDLNMKVICEGVETKEQEEFLRQIGCRYAQGFLYAHPIPKEQFASNYLDAE